jgi:hypothetical protein
MTSEERMPDALGNFPYLVEGSKFSVLGSPLSYYNEGF